MISWFEKGKQLAENGNYQEAMKAFNNGATTGEKECIAIVVYSNQSFSDDDRLNVIRKAYKQLNLNMNFEVFINSFTSVFGDNFVEGREKQIDWTLTGMKFIFEGDFLKIYRSEIEMFKLNELLKIIETVDKMRTF